jgi:hypothetical protein
MRPMSGAAQIEADQIIAGCLNSSCGRVPDMNGIAPTAFS